MKFEPIYNLFILYIAILCAFIGVNTDAVKESQNWMWVYRTQVFAKSCIELPSPLNFSNAEKKMTHYMTIYNDKTCNKV